MSDPLPGCDLACQTKIIINGGNVRAIADANYDAFKRLPAEAFRKMDGKKIIQILNRMEDDAVEVQKLLVKGVGYVGETGKMLKE